VPYNGIILLLAILGTCCLTDTMSATFYNPKLRQSIEAIIKPCEHCQKYMNVHCGHGETAPREAGLLLWSEIAMDMISPQTLEVSNRNKKLNALTII
jgi:hypothetical protein